MRILFTDEGLEKLKKDKEGLAASRPDAVADLKKAREMGDLSENGYYRGAKFKLSDIDRNLRRLDYLIKNSRVAEKPKKGIISIGSKVNIEINGGNREYLIVGEYEADPSEGRISYKSPIGRVLVGKTVGEKRTIETPTGQKEVLIKKIG